MKIHKKRNNTALFLTSGMVLKEGAALQKENRVYTLLIKGFLVYLIVMGGMGCFLSALDLEYSHLAVHIVLLAMALFCAMLYYHKRWENIGYIFLLALLVFVGSGLRTYINSGFYSIANVIAETASDFFGTSASRNYGEQVGNRYMAVTVSMCYLGGIGCILMNILISRVMRYFLAIPSSIVLLFAPLYLEKEPDGVYAIMLLSGIFAAYIMRSSGHYKLTGNNDAYEFRMEKGKISYVYAHSALAGVLAAAVALCFLTVGLLSLLYPKKQFQAAHPMSAWKKSTMDTAENISRLGMFGLFNIYPNTGGLTSGTLGGVSSIRLDFETDLRIEFTPYQEKTLYLKTFTGATYLPYENRWSRRVDANQRAVIEADDTVYRLKERYERKEAYSARGIMQITNVAAPIGVYLPYYSEDADKTVYPGRTVAYTYYPLLSDGRLAANEISDGTDGLLAGADGTGADESVYGMEDRIDWQWLEVPEENREVIASFCQEAGLSYGRENALETAVKLAQYYQDNLPYTLRPGMTPYRRDFVNYFLSDNRRGYCAHFASAATLIFRYLGIPARYVEGYAISMVDLAQRGEFVEDAQYEQYYDGYSPLGTEAVMTVDATDANAHAWVEIYDDERGWVVVEVTPASDEPEDSESLWQRLMNFLTGNQDGEAEEEQTEEAQEEDAAGEQSRWLFLAVIKVLSVVVVLAVLCRWLLRKALGIYRYCHAGWSGKLIIRYQKYIRKIARNRKGLTNMVNYGEQTAWLKEHGFWEAGEEEIKECVRILEQAGFSRTEITEQEFERVVGHIRRPALKKMRRSFSQG